MEKTSPSPVRLLTGPLFRRQSERTIGRSCSTTSPQGVVQSTDLLVKRIFARVLQGSLPAGLLCLALVVVNCGGMGGGKRPRYPAKVTSQMEAEFSGAERLYKSRQIGAALIQYRKFIEIHPHTPLTDEAYYKISKIYFLQTKWDLAVEQLVALARLTPDPEYRAKAYLMASYALVKKPDFTQARVFIERVEANQLPAKQQIRLYSLMVLYGNQMGLTDQDYALLRLVDAYHESVDPSIAQLEASDLITKNRALQSLENWIVKPISVDHIPAWMRNYPKGFVKPYIEYKLGKIFFEGGQQARAESQLSRYVRAYPKHLYVSSAQSLLEQLGGRVVLKKGEGELRIGVLLPLSGPRGVFGKATLQGIQCAAAEHPSCRQILGPLLQGLGNVKLVVRDTKGDTDNIDQLINELVREDVSAIIGPMTATAAEVAAKRAQEVRVPIFPITQKSGLMEMGRYVYQMGYDTEQQVRDVVRVARQRGIKSFGLFYPDSNYGRKMAETFRKEAEQQGGKVVADASFDPANLDLASQVRKLKLGMSRFSYAGKGAGFEALFIPDSYWMVKRLAPALQFVTIRDIPLIGTNAWNDPKLSQQDLKDFPGSFFVDLYYSNNSTDLVAKFVSGYEMAFRSTPTSIAALGFDAVWFIRQAFEKAGSERPAELRDALSTMVNIRGVTGIRSFSSGPEVHPFVLTVGESGVVLVE